MGRGGITAAIPGRPEAKPPERRAKIDEADMMMLMMEWGKKLSLVACCDPK
jgi:hypothetical protein